MTRILLFPLLFACTIAFAQPASYNVGNLHSHNDYEKPIPFWEAYSNGYGSIEADIFLRGDNLIIAHDTTQAKLGRTLDSFYLKPLEQLIQKNNGYPYADKNKSLQLLVDLKTAAEPTLQKLVDKLKAYPSIINCAALKIAITGNRPPANTFNTYPSFIWFDGELYLDYPSTALDRIVMLSDDFKRYSRWSGHGVIPAAEKAVVEKAIAKAHGLHKKVRFWNAPDVINSWYRFMQLGTDYINTDQITGLATFMKQLPDRMYTATYQYQTYTPLYKNDGTAVKVKNIILLIGDGTGLAQWYAGYTANKGNLNVFKMKHTGLSKTSSYDSYITDSAPGSTAFSSGEKTNNRAVGVDHDGKPLLLLPDILIKKKIKTGLITSGDVTDATPADFYAHQSERTHSEAILNDLLQSPVDFLMGDTSLKTNALLETKLATQFKLLSTIDSVTNDASAKWLVREKRAGLSMLEGRGDWAQKAFAKGIALLSQNKAGFFLMLEGAQVDHGGHDNKLPWLTTEVMDFDQVIGKAMQFADSNGETLVIVTADHETGGLTLTDGDISKGYISGQFSTNDHTAIPVPVFAYGPGSQLFTGVYENTEVFKKILTALGVNK
ncbi:MAG: alkaline phosphatase [Chitinophagaceae bacterium]